ncbi:MAG TPA: tetratricopeptide repeat protein, partial [Gemmatimonadaceae bacterium]
MSSSPRPFDELRARAAQFIEKAKTAQRHGDADGALAHYDDALALMEDEGDSPMAADALRWKGLVLRERGDTAAAYRFFNRSLALAERLDYVNG